MTRSAFAAADHRPTHRAEILSGDNDRALARLADLRADRTVEVRDLAGEMARQLEQLVSAPTAAELAEPNRWIFYPWRRLLISVLGPTLFRRVRLDRNRHKITDAEQLRLSELAIGVVGLSVGHSIAYNLALEGLCGRLRLADFDTVELSNLNRIPVGIADIGLNKAVSAARRIAELDPYLPVDIQPRGLTSETISDFFQGLDLLIEECDSLDIKILARETARAQHIPVLMETSDRGLFDAELFDAEPGRPLLHGLLGDIDAASMQGLSTHDKAPYIMRILETGQLSARMAASMAEIDRTITSWPQLGGDVLLGAATVATAIRKYARGDLRSGRIRIDLDQELARLTSPPLPDSPEQHIPPSDAIGAVPEDPLEAIVHAIRLAPSGGNSQPWLISMRGSALQIRLDRRRPSAMDVADRACYVAIGAALLNARVAAAWHRIPLRITPVPQGDCSEVVAEIKMVGRPDPALADDYPAMIERMTNRSFGRREPLTDSLVRMLTDSVRSEGALLTLVTDAVELGRLAGLLAASDRVRYLTPHQHSSMMDELHWPDRDRLDVGIDVRTLDLDPSDLAKLQISARADVMESLADWDLGHALGDGIHDRIVSSSALAVVKIKGDHPLDYLRGGAAVELLWIRAQQVGLAVHPVSPIFLYARNRLELAGLSPEFTRDLQSLKQQFDEILGLEQDEAPVLVLRLSHHARPAVRSGRLPRHETVTVPVDQDRADE